MVRLVRPTVLRSAFLGQHGVVHRRQDGGCQPSPQPPDPRRLPSGFIQSGLRLYQFLDTENPSRLAQRGHAKSKRTDLRIVGLALLVSVDFHVPLLWQVYPGNQHDTQSFAQALQELTPRYQALARDCQSITLIFDKGNNSAANQEILDASGFHFVGSLVPTHYPDLLAIPLKEFSPLQDSRLVSIKLSDASRGPRCPDDQNCDLVKPSSRSRNVAHTHADDPPALECVEACGRNSNSPSSHRYCVFPDSARVRHEAGPGGLPVLSRISRMIACLAQPPKFVCGMYTWLKYDKGIGTLGLILNGAVTFKLRESQPGGSSLISAGEPAADDELPAPAQPIRHPIKLPECPGYRSPLAR